MSEDLINPLPELNSNYNPPQPWRCVTHAQHDCNGPVIGAVGAIPVCRNGADAEQRERDENAARIRAWAESAEGQAALRREAAIERRLEFR